MPERRAQLEGHAWSLAQRGIGRSLRELYEQSRQLPPRLAALAEELSEKVEPSGDEQPRNEERPGRSRN
jgi:hypothetical protein